MKHVFSIGRAICLSVFAVVVSGYFMPAMKMVRFPLWALISIVAAAVWYFLHNITARVRKIGVPVSLGLKQFVKDEVAQDVAEYAVMLALILVIVVGTLKLIGGNANNVFSSVASSVSGGIN